MVRAGFETATPATMRPQTYALDPTATVIGLHFIYLMASVDGCNNVVPHTKQTHRAKRLSTTAGNPHIVCGPLFTHFKPLKRDILQKGDPLQFQPLSFKLIILCFNKPYIKAMSDKATS
jgi:hypothetical protein